MCDPKKSGIRDDPRMPWYSQIEKWTSKYASTIGMYGSYGHQFEHANINELLKFDMVAVRSGCIGRLDGDIHLRWKAGDSAFDFTISNVMSLTRWLEIKRAYKLCDNDTAIKRGDPGYDPAYKYDSPIFAYMFLYFL